MSEIKPCPFCGSTRVGVFNRLEIEPEMERVGLTKDNWNVLCDNCFAWGGTRRTAGEAIEAWNRRMTMPKEYIEREALLKRMEKRLAYLRTDFGSYGHYADGFEEGCIAVDDADAADVVEVVHGEWKLKHIGAGHYWECSVCHTNPCIYVTENTKFCPNCGARMDGGNEDAAD